MRKGVVYFKQAWSFATEVAVRTQAMIDGTTSTYNYIHVIFLLNHKPPMDISYESEFLIA